MSTDTTRVYELIYLAESKQDYTSTNVFTRSEVPLTLGENVHWVIDLNVHVIADRLEVFAFGGDKLPVLAPDLVRRRAILGEAAGNDDALPEVLRPECFLALVLQLNCNFRNAGAANRKLHQNGDQAKLTFVPHG